MFAQTVAGPVAQFTQTGGQDVPVVGGGGEGLLENGRHLLRKSLPKTTWVQPQQKLIKGDKNLDHL
jgi:hypothetical protein